MGFFVRTDDQSYQADGKRSIYVVSKRLGDSLRIDCNKRYGSNTATIEVAWSSAGTPRPSLTEVEKFGQDVLKAHKVAKKLKAMKEIPLKKRK